MLWHDLALRLGSTITDLQRKMSVKEFRSWIAFNELSPIGDIRGDYQSAQICQMLYQLNSTNKSKKMSIKDFLLFKIKTKADFKMQKLPEQIKKVIKVFRDI